MENRPERLTVKHTWIVPGVASPKLLTLGEQVAAALDRIHAGFEDKRLGVSLELLNPDLPLVVDPAILQRILMILLRNAICDTPEGGEIKLSATNSGSQLVIQIRDAGPGYSPAGLAEMFQRRSRRATGPLEDTGPSPKGLMLARYLAGLHGGAITAISEAGQGTSFTVLLPQHLPYGRKAPNLPAIS